MSSNDDLRNIHFSKLDVEVERDLERFLESPLGQFQNSSDRFAIMMSNPLDELGVVVRCHIVIEFHLNQHFIRRCALTNFEKLGLKFSSLVELIDESDKQLFALKPALRQLNKLRNQYAHKLFVELEDQNLDEVVQILDGDSHLALEEETSKSIKGVSDETRDELHRASFTNRTIDIEGLNAREPLECIKWLAYRVFLATHLGLLAADS